MQWGGGGYGSAHISVTKVNSSTLAALRRGGLWVCQISGKNPLHNSWTAPFNVGMGSVDDLSVKVRHSCENCMVVSCPVRFIDITNLEVCWYYTLVDEFFLWN